MTVNEIVELYNDGYSITWISGKINRNYKYVRKRLVDSGVQIRSLDMARKTKRLPVMNYSDDICNDYLDGITITNLCKKYNTSFGVVKKILLNNIGCSRLLSSRSNTVPTLPDNVIDEYLSGIGIKQLSNRYNFHERGIKQYLLDNGVVIRNRSDAAKVCNRPKLTESHRQKISLGRKKYLHENPDKVPYLLNHSSKESYPEKRFRRILESIGLGGWIQHYQHSIYQYDFAFPIIKLDVEIDGNTHRLQSVIDKDTIRDKFSRDNGWEVLRFTASEFHADASKCIDTLILTIKRLDPNYDIYDIDKWNQLKLKLHKSSKYGYKCSCGRSISRSSSTCLRCKSINERKVDRPSIETLISDINSTSFVATGRKYGVSDNTVRKWLKSYDVDPKHLI